MSPRENLYRLIDQLPDEKAEALERLVIQILRNDSAWGRPRAGMSWDEAIEHVFADHGELLKNLAK